MQFPESWLREFCDPAITTEELGDQLTMAGLEVEEAHAVAPMFEGVVVGLVLEVQPHPDADRLRVCKVDAGQASVLQIVCGAPNVKEGIKVPCALVGAKLPSKEGAPAFQIKTSKLRGVESQGMLCSAKELGVGEGADGLLVLSDSAQVGANLRAHLQLDDTIFTLKLTPNLAHCLSLRGVARELSAITGAPFKPVQVGSLAAKIPDVLKVHVHAQDLCGRFSGRIIKGVNTRARTPEWMVEKLARCGQRSVTALVDISNFVMFELGQPTHIFDLDKIHGDLHVRWAKPGESLELLNGQRVDLDGNVGVIADDQKVESLAGIMGGNATAVSDDTQNIYIEAAFWWPQAVAGRSRRFNFSTDAGHRFERGVDPQQTLEAIERISQLVLEICGTPNSVCGPLDDQVIHLPKRDPVSVRVSRANRVLGLELSADQMMNALRRLDLHPVSKGDTIEIIPPSRRFDLNIEEDLIEEIARMVGFSQLPSTPPVAPIVPRVLEEATWSLDRVKLQMAAMGYQETINFSFIEKEWETDLHGNADPIAVLNPIASQMSVMRSSLLGSLLSVLKYNIDRKVESVQAFEVGRVFKKDAQVADSLKDVGGFAQPLRIAGLCYGSHQPMQWGQTARPADFFDVKADVEALFMDHALTFKAQAHPGLHPGRSARVYRKGQPIGWVGELHPVWRAKWGLTQSPAFFELDLDAVLDRGLPSTSPISRFPSVSRDIAVVVAEEVTHDQLIESAWSVQHGGILKDMNLFDVYRPKVAGERGLQLGEKSMAIRLVMNDIHGTLTEDQIERIRVDVINVLMTQLNARLRD